MGEIQGTNVKAASNFGRNSVRKRFVNFFRKLFRLNKSPKVCKKITNHVKNNFKNSSKNPGKDWKWRGQPGSKPGSKEGSWVRGKEYLRPDINHGQPQGPHWDYRGPDGTMWRIDPNGNFVPK